MIELQGKYNNAKIFTDIVDNESISQVIELLNQPFAKDSRIRMMPDIHAGAGCTISTTMTVTDTVCPNLVGVDIGCGMEVIRIRESHIELQKLDKVVYNKIPSGFAVRSDTHKMFNHERLGQLKCIKYIDALRAEKSCGTLGGGNHFIEADKDDEGNIYIVIHSGSRHLGVEVANFYQNEAYKRLTGTDKESIRLKQTEIIEKLKSEGRQKDIQEELKKLDVGYNNVKVPKALAYCKDSLFGDYIHDMKIVQEFAMCNRQAMVDEIVRGMKLHVVEQFTTIHNYIDTDQMILRKGSVSAAKGEKFIVPINMRDGSLICIGKGNEDWNWSAPHGAGRLMSRSQAKESFTVSEFKKQMDGIYSTSVNCSTLDECPMAYKNMQDIVDNIEPTADIVKIIKPIYNFKAGEAK